MMRKNQAEAASGSVSRRQPLLPEKQQHKGIGEVAGGTTAECAALCCCCPLTVMNLLILTVYKVPKGLCKKALRKKKKKKLLKHRNDLLMEEQRQQQQQQQQQKKNGAHNDSESDGGDRAVDDPKDAVDLDDEMWDRFHTGGFWRNSHREE